jgi:hypothetical protein
MRIEGGDETAAHGPSEGVSAVEVSSVCRVRAGDEEAVGEGGLDRRCGGGKNRQQIEDG